MFWLRRLLTARVTPDILDRHFGPFACFAAAPALLYFALRAIERFAATPGEIVIGMLSAIAASLAFIVIGLMLPAKIPSAHL